MYKVTSPSNARLKIARMLHSRSGIQKHGLFLMEGPRFVSDYMQKEKPEWIIVSEEAAQLSRTTAKAALNGCIDVLEIPEKLFADISDTESSQGITAVCRLPSVNIESIPREGVFLLLDRISDPGNMGTIIRSAAAFGCTAVIAGKGSCCPFAPKVTRAAAGLNSVAKVSFDTDLAAFMRSNADEMDFYGAVASGEDIDRFQKGDRCIGLVVGSEAHGISEKVVKQLKGIIAIPMAEGVESLNAAVSASILLYHLGCRA